MKTIRLLLPQWQGGMDKNYLFGAELLNFIAPKNNDEVVEIKVAPKRIQQPEEGQLDEEMAQLKQLEETWDRLNEIKPERIIVFGGDCSVSQVPCDYLSKLYGDSLGIIWLDAHPDISVIEESRHNHELVLANIMGIGKSIFAEKMENPISPDKVCYAGLVEDPTRKMSLFEEDIKLKQFSPEELIKTSQDVIDWIKENKINKLFVHFDLDALSPEDFRSLTSAKPYRTPEEYGAAIGKLKLDTVVRFLNDVNNSAEIVGLTIAEHMPWDAINLRNALSQLPIFK